MQSMNVRRTGLCNQNWPGFYFTYRMQRHKPEGVKTNLHAYLMEAAGLAGFVITAGLIVIFLEHPSLPVMQGKLSQHLAIRRVILGIAMGLYIMGATLLIGKRSGAHMNPAVTLAFYGLGKMHAAPAAGYIVAQFIGASCGALLLLYATHGLFAHPVINYAMTEPQVPHGMLTAFTAESIISFINMFLVLATTSSKRFEKWSPVVAGICIASFIAFELPFSGMSMNPARSFAASLAANKWKHIWIYCVAPVAFMLLAAEVFVRWKEKRSLLNGAKKERIVEKEEDYKSIPDYPIRAA